ncbi:MAG: hypothetical protein QXO71_03635 [Candidatus Jordarchaeaceae archaeon]
MSCSICESLGKAFVDFDEGERFPEGFYKLELVQWFSDLHDLRRCPQYGAY